MQRGTGSSILSSPVIYFPLIRKGPGFGVCFQTFWQTVLIRFVTCTDKTVEDVAVCPDADVLRLARGIFYMLHSPVYSLSRNVKRLRWLPMSKIDFCEFQKIV